MAKKSMKEVAQAGTSVFEQLRNNGANYSKDAESAKDVQYVQDAKSVQPAKSVKDAKAKKEPEIQWERLNLRIPADIKEYLTIAAAKASIEHRRNISLTEYLCDLVRADMKDKN